MALAGELTPFCLGAARAHAHSAARPLGFSTNDEYVEKKFPDDYWPATAEPPSKEAWQESVRALKEDLEAFEELIRNPDSNLYAQIPWGKEDQTLLREVLLAADHNSYHTGELVFLRRILGLEGLRACSCYFQLTASCQRN